MYFVSLYTLTVGRLIRKLSYHISLCSCAVGSCSQPHNPRLLIWVPKALRPPAPSCLQPHISAFLYSFIQTNWMPPNAPARTFSQSLLFASVVGYVCKAHLSDRQLRWGTLKVQLKCPDINRDIFLCSSPFPCSKSSNTNIYLCLIF